MRKFNFETLRVMREEQKVILHIRDFERLKNYVAELEAKLSEKKVRKEISRPRPLIRKKKKAHARPITPLRAKRLEMGLSQVELARRVEAQQPTISYIENGMQQPTSELLHKLAEVLQCEVGELI